MEETCVWTPAFRKVIFFVWSESRGLKRKKLWVGRTSWRALLGRKGSLLHQHFFLWGYGQTEVTDLPD